MTNKEGKEKVQEQTKLTFDIFANRKIPARRGEVKTMEGNNKPEHVRVGGIEVALWINTGDKGDYVTVTLHRSYKDKDNNWQKTNTLRTADIPKAILALQKAYEKIVLKE